MRVRNGESKCHLFAEIDKTVTSLLRVRSAKWSAAEAGVKCLKYSPRRELVKRILREILLVFAAMLIALLVAWILFSVGFLHRTIGMELSLSELMAIATSFTAIGTALWKVPKWQVAWLSREGITPDKIVELEGAARDNLTKILGGAFFLGTLFFTWQNLQIERLKEANSEKGQITERFSHAVDQLGSKDRNVRVGGIYALEQVANASPELYQWTVTEILAAFVRQQGPWRSKPITPFVACEKLRPRGTPANQPEVDIQTALEVIGRRQLEYAPPLNGQSRAVDLRHADLRGVNLSTANLEYAALTDSNLEAASITSADLMHATLRGANLVCAYMPASHFQDADLKDANIEGAAFTDPDNSKYDADGLTCNQIQSAHSNLSTLLPAYLKGGNCSKSTPETPAPPTPRP